MKLDQRDFGATLADCVIDHARRVVREPRATTTGVIERDDGRSLLVPLVMPNLDEVLVGIWLDGRTEIARTSRIDLGPRGES